MQLDGAAPLIFYCRENCKTRMNLIGEPRVCQEIACAAADVAGYAAIAGHAAFCDKLHPIVISLGY